MNTGAIDLVLLDLDLGVHGSGFEVRCSPVVLSNASHSVSPSGLQVLATLREHCNPDVAALPAVAVSASAFQQEIEHCLSQVR